MTAMQKDVSLQLSALCPFRTLAEYAQMGIWRSSACDSEFPDVELFRDGFLVTLLNSKTTLYFAAFPPQFMDAHASPLQTLALGKVLVGIACCTDLMYGLTASLIASRLNRAAQHTSWGNRLAGTSFITLGVANVYRYAARALSHCCVVDGACDVSWAGQNQSQRFKFF